MTPTPASPLLNLLTHPEHLLLQLTHLGTGPVADTALGTAALGTARALARWHTRRALARGGRQVHILAPPSVDPTAGRALWANLSGLMRPWWRRLLAPQPHLAFEYTWTGEHLTISLWLPAPVPEAMIRRAVEAAWPGAHTTTSKATPPLPHDTAAPAQAVTGGTLRLARPEVLPLECDHKTDPLRALLGAATGLRPGESCAVQLLARPVTGRRRRRATRAAGRLKAGRHPGRLIALLDLLTHRPQRGTTDRFDPAHAAEVRAVAEKLSGPLWETSLRYAVTATAQRVHPSDGGPPLLSPAPQVLRAQARGRVHALASAFSLFAGRNWYARHHLPRPGQALAARRFPRRGDLLSVPELAALAHLPLDPSAPGLTRAGARSIAPPTGIPLPARGVKPLGSADAGPRRPIGLAVADGRHHLHIIGATGSGKSTLMGNLILDDVTAGRGAVVIDPKGDLIPDLLGRLPERAIGRTVVLDPDDTAPPPCLNVLAGADGDVVVDNLTGIFRRIFAAFWGPRTDDVMRAACLTLLHHSENTGIPVTLADIPRLLTEPAYRAQLTYALDDPVLAGFWVWYEQLSEPSRAAATGPLLNKLRAFLLRDFVRRAIAAGPSTFDLGDVLDGGLALVRVPKGVLGEETARLLGSFVVAKTWQAAAHRAGTGEHQRADAALYVDECHNFLTLPYPLEDMLAEARAYHLSLVLAHQNLAQLPRDLREGISANARTKVFFNASPEDARDLERHTQPALSAYDLAHLGAYQAAARLVVASADTRAFTLTTRPLPARIPGRATAVRKAARASYATTLAPDTPTTPVADPRR